MLLDGDAGEDARRIHQELAGVVRNRVLVTLPNGLDPGDMESADLRQLIIGAAKQQGVDLLALGKPLSVAGADLVGEQPLQLSH